MDINIIDVEQLNAKLYDAIIRKDRDEVIGLLDEANVGPMHEVTIHNDSVLHVALYTRQTDLVDELMVMMHQMSEDDEMLTMTRINSLGNTILHEAATHDEFLSIARMMVELQPQLLTLSDKNGETALFRAARYGQLEMFKLLDDQLKRTCDEEAEYFHMKHDDSTTLHAAIDAEHFELALWIAKKHDYLHDKKNYEGLTALQLLASNPLAFQFRGQGLLKRFIDSRIKNYDEDEGSSRLQEEVASGCSVPWWDEMLKKRQSYNAVVALAKLLIKNDLSWRVAEYTDKILDPETHEDVKNDVKDGYGKKTEDEEHAQKSELNKIEAEVKKIEAHMKKTDEDELKEIEVKKKKLERQKTVPLILATQTGCFEIVDEILRQYPQAVEHIDEKGRSILHTAIEYRQMEIFDEVVKRMELPIKRLMRKRDTEGNSILHMVGKSKRSENVPQTGKRSAFFQLQDDLLLFEHIKDVIAPHFYKHTNKAGETAEELLALNTKDVWGKSQDWLKRTADNCSIIAVLIATVAFAAAYTVPGGSNPENGSPVLLNQTFFVIFTIGDVLSLTFCLTAAIIFLWILTSSFELQEFKHALPQKLMLGITCLLFSVTMMMLAFSATIILMIRYNERWTKIALYTVALLPVTVLVTVYMQLYLSLMKTFEYTLKIIGSYFRWSYCKKKIKAPVPVDSNPTLKFFPSFV